MDSPIPFFAKGPMRPFIQVNKIITLTHPQPSRWKIIEILNEVSYQAEEEDEIVSNACINLCCHAVGQNPGISQRRAMIRATFKFRTTNHTIDGLAGIQTRHKVFSGKEFQNNWL